MIQTGRLMWINLHFDFHAVNSEYGFETHSLRDAVTTLNRDGWVMCGTSIENNDTVYWFTRTVES